MIVEKKRELRLGNFFAREGGRVWKRKRGGKRGDSEGLYIHLQLKTEKSE